MAITKAITVTRRVGRGGENLKADVENVVKLLGKVPASEGGTSLHTTPAKDHLVTAIRKFQYRQFACANGRIDPGELSIRRLNELFYKTNGTSGPLVFDTPMRQAMPAAALHGIRSVVEDEIVKMAAAQVGKISANNGNVFGFPEIRKRGYVSVYPKKGWELLKRILDSTIIDEKLPDDEIQEAGKKAGHKSWCGIFAFWCLNQVAVKTTTVATDIGWSTVVGAPVYRSKGSPTKATRLPDVKGHEGLHKGAICVVDEYKEVDGKDVFLNHHVIVAERPSKGVFKTIEGNYWDPKTKTNQSIVERTRTKKEILYYWDYWAPDTL